jgi:anti-sigma factor ChrR (cupin superfamily)
MGSGILVRSDDSAWQQSPIPGVQLRHLYEQKTLLVRMAPKTSYPAHQHHAAEQCLVLEGSISSDGVTAYAGDFTYMPAGSSHHPLYTEEGCMLLIAYT